MENLDKSLGWHITQHQLFVNSQGEKGTQLVFEDVDLSEIVFRKCNLDGATFEKISALYAYFDEIFLKECNFSDIHYK